jgi:hypothetical protein
MIIKLKNHFIIIFFTVILVRTELNQNKFKKIAKLWNKYNRLKNENINYGNDFLEILKERQKKQKKLLDTF